MPPSGAVAEGRRAHRHTGPRAGSSPLLSLAANGLGALLTGFAWIYLVSAAIDFGTVAVRGQTAAWIFTVGASAGAVLCLVLMLTFVSRGMRTLGYISDYRPRRAAARRRSEPAPRPPRRGSGGGRRPSGR